MQSNTTAPADPAIPPSADDYSAAFYGLENQIHKIRRHTKLANYLVSLTAWHFEQKKPASAEMVSEFASGVIEDLLNEVDDLDTEFLAKFNDLVGRENAALRFPA